MKFLKVTGAVEKDAEKAVEKAISVIFSCKTMAQLTTAEVFAYKVVKRYERCKRYEHWMLLHVFMDAVDTKRETIRRFDDVKKHIEKRKRMKLTGDRTIIYE